MVAGRRRSPARDNGEIMECPRDLAGTHAGEYRHSIEPITSPHDDHNADSAPVFRSTGDSDAKIKSRSGMAPGQ